MKKIYTLPAALALAVAMLGTASVSASEAPACTNPTIRVVDKAAYTETIEHPAETQVINYPAVPAVTQTIPAVAGVWQNFSPNKEEGPLDGQPAWPVDPRGTWQHEDKSIPPGHEGPDGVYQKGEGHGSWFYRAAGTPEEVTILTPAKDAWTETKVITEAYITTVEHPATYKNVTNPDYPCMTDEPTEPVEPEEPLKPTPDEPVKPTPEEPDKPNPVVPDKPNPVEPEEPLKPTPVVPDKPTTDTVPEPTPNDSSRITVVPGPRPSVLPTNPLPAVPSAVDAGV